MTTIRYDIVSDTHGNLSPELLAELQGADVIVHAGDMCSPYDLRELERIAPVHACLGNNDWASEYPPSVKSRTIFVSGGLKWQICHYRQHLVLQMSDIAICGHTHTPFIERDPRTNTLIMNPGSPTYPRRSKPSMGRILVDGDTGTILDASIITLG